MTIYVHKCIYIVLHIHLYIHTKQISSYLQIHENYMNTQTALEELRVVCKSSFTKHHIKYVAHNISISTQIMDDSFPLFYESSG